MNLTAINGNVAAAVGDSVGAYIALSSTFAELGTAAGPVGAVVGFLVGSILGDVFGDDPPSYPPGFGSAIPRWDQGTGGFYSKCVPQTTNGRAANVVVDC